MKVLGIGEVVLDKSCILSEYPKEDSKVRPLEVKHSVGGPVPSALILLSRLGIECELYANYGNDHEGKLIQRKLAQEGVRLSGEKKKLTKVNTYLVNSNNGSRTGIKSEVQYSKLKRVPKNLLKGADLILIDRHEPIAFDFILKNKKNKTKIIIDPSSEYSKETIRLIKHSEHPILPITLINKIENINIESRLKDIRKITKRPIIVTLGEMGSIIYNGKVELVPPLDLSPIDTLGAGDVFRGAFAYGILKGWKLENTVRYANIVAGLQCLKPGNSTAIPTKDDIEKTLVNPKFKTVELKKVLRQF